MAKTASVCVVLGFELLKTG